MEQQFILRLPERLRSMDSRDFKLSRISHREVVLHVKDKVYPGIVCRLPTIVESQKYIDNKLYKIADISTLVVIYENNDFSLEDEIYKHECSGLTPPMSYAKERRFSTATIRTEEVEEIERKVAELLREDSNAIKVEVITNEKDSSDVDLDILAAEIENDMSVSREAQSSDVLLDNPALTHQAPIKSCEPHASKSRDEQHPHTQSGLDSKPQGDQTRKRPVVDKTMVIPHPADVLGSVTTNKDATLGEVLSSQDRTGVSTVPRHTYNQPQTPESPPQVLSVRTEEESSHHQSKAKHPEIIELENKIREKQEMVAKAVNPILKKRFEQSLSELKSEYEKKKKEYP